jgi:RHS repeat-associated protein
MGSTAYATRKNASVVAYTSYDEWGKITTPTYLGTNFAGVDDVADYTGHGYDTVLNKYFAQWRMYDAENRRFMAVDPVKSGVNWYSYVGNSPVMFFDPTGLKLQMHEDNDKKANDTFFDLLKNLTNDPLTMDEYGNVTIKTDVESNSTDKPTGTDLIKQIIDDPNFTVTLKETIAIKSWDGVSAIRPDTTPQLEIDGNLLYGIGKPEIQERILSNQPLDSIVSIHFDSVPLRGVSSTGTGEGVDQGLQVYVATSPEVVLAHELIHGWAYGKGKSRILEDSIYSKGNYEEYVTIGIEPDLSERDYRPATENSIRKEQKDNYMRIGYESINIPPMPPQYMILMDLC